MKQKNKITLAIAGPIGSGKSSISEHISKVLGIKIIKTRDIVSQYIIAAGENVDDNKLQTYGLTLMTPPGSDKFCEFLIKEIKEESCIIDSLRPYSHYKYLKDHLNDFLLIYIHAPIEKRIERFLQRKDRDNTLSDYQKRSTHPVEKEVNQLIDFADIIINNTDFEKSKKQSVQDLYPSLFTDEIQYFQQIINLVKSYHSKHGYAINSGTKEHLSLFVGLMVEELGEIHECLTKGNGDIAEEHADLLYLLLGSCISIGLDIESAILTKHQINMGRSPKGNPLN